VAVLKETADKQPELVKRHSRGVYRRDQGDRAGKTRIFEANAKELFGLKTPEEITAGLKRTRENYADVWGEKFFESQNKMLQQGIALSLLPSVGNLNDLWIK
jgi:hypothetical protein